MVYTEETGLTYDALYKSRLSLMRGIFGIQQKLDSLKFKTGDIMAETIEIIIMCDELTSSNAADLLQEMGEVNESH